MTGLQTARALVLDDRPEQAMPVVQALSALGIASLYHDGSADYIQGPKLRGVRMLFLDMVLGEWGADESNPTQCAQMVVSALEQTIEAGDDPIVAVCWTAHADIVEDFEECFARTFPRNHLTKVLTVNKPEAREDFHDAAVLASIKETVIGGLNAIPSMGVLFSWEQMVHDGTTAATSTFTRLVADYHALGDSEWDDCALKLLAALARAQGGERLVGDDSRHALNSVLDALNPILVDALDHDRPRMEEPLQALADRIKQGVVAQSDHGAEGAPKAPLPGPVRAKINAKLHLAEDVRTGEAEPGTLYLLASGSPNRTVARQAGLVDRLLMELRDDTFFWGDGAAPPRDEFSPCCIPLMMEFSASCDYAQAKRKLPRFVAGYMILGDRFLANLRTRTEYLWRLEPLFLDNGDGGEPTCAVIVINAHYVFAMENGVARNLNPFRRLRKEALGDATFWLANHMTRPGVLRV